MRFDGNISELGFEYHASSEKHNEDGTTTVRWVLTKKPTEEQKAELDKYENLKLVENGAQYRYDPHLVWDVIYQNTTVEEPEEEPVTEDLVEDPTDYSEAVWVDNEFGGSIYDQVLPAMQVANSLKTQYEELAKNFPNNSELFNDLAKNCQEQLDQLATVLNTDTIVK